MMSSEFYHITTRGDLEKITTLEGAASALKDDGYVWVNYTKASREELAELSAPLGLHPLSLEDCTDETQVPKMDEFPNYTFIVFNALRYDPEELVSDEVDFFIGNNFLVTVSGYADYTRFPLGAIMPVIERNISAVKKGPAWLMHLIIDHMVDNMADMVEQAEVDIDHAEEEILDSPSDFDPSRLTYLRRNLLSLRKSLFYEREILIKISRNDCEFVPEKATVHYRDIFDHISNFLEMTESNRDNVTSLMELYASMLNNKMARDSNETNATVRRLTFITTIFMPLTLLAGIFGMSEWTAMTGGEGNMRRSYLLFAIMMVAIGLGSYLFIRWLEWRDRKRSG
ncbi:MAG: magnesium transporter CorA family protein [Bacteroidales bacterium]|jgi:magnesium transporter|nr:magnesium transporter CorA family protein [Bacteroidales bacterium]